MHIIFNRTIPVVYEYKLCIESGEGRKVAIYNFLLANQRTQFDNGGGGGLEMSCTSCNSFHFLKAMHFKM